MQVSSGRPKAASSQVMVRFVPETLVKQGPTDRSETAKSHVACQETVQTYVAEGTNACPLGSWTKIETTVVYWGYIYYSIHWDNRKENGNYYSICLPECRNLSITAKPELTPVNRPHPIPELSTSPPKP